MSQSKWSNESVFPKSSFLKSRHERVLKYKTPNDVIDKKLRHEILSNSTEDIAVEIVNLMNNMKILQTINKIIDWGLTLMKNYVKEMRTRSILDKNRLVLHSTDLSIDQ